MKKNNLEAISVLGSGWLGLALGTFLRDLGHPILISTTQNKKLADLKSQGFSTCLLNIDELKDNEDSNVFFSSPTMIINITSKNISGFKNLLGKIQIADTKNIIFVSSTSVYHPNQEPITEDANFENEESSLFKIENLFLNNRNINTTIIRFAGLIGPNRHPGNFFKNKSNLENGSSPVNLIHLDDCIGIISEIIRQDLFGETFNACASTHPSKKDFYTRAALSLNLSPPHFEDNSLISHKIICNHKIKKILSYSFKYDDIVQAL